MKLASTALLSFALSGALTFTGLSWPRYVRPGWFQLEGQPRAVDGQPVQDWQHVNEVLARNVSAVSTNGAFPDLIELHNPRATSVDLSGLRLTDDLNAPNRFVFPAGTSIPAGGYLVLRASASDGSRDGPGDAPGHD